MADIKISNNNLIMIYKNTSLQNKKKYDIITIISKSAEFYNIFSMKLK